MSIRSDKQTPTANATRSRWRAWLIPLLWLFIAAVAAVVPWAWRQWQAPQRAAPRSLPPLALTGDSRRDREAILVRAAELLASPSAELPFPDEGLVPWAATMGEIGRALLSLDRTKGETVVKQAIAMAIRPADRITAADLEAPELSQIGMLVRLARSLQPYPELAGTALRAAFAEAQANRSPAYRIYAMCLFAREAAPVDPAWARTAARQAGSIVIYLRDPSPATPFAIVASVTAQVEGPAAARPFVQLALQSIPTGPARPLVEGRVAAWLMNAAPARAHELARQALADVGVEAFGRSGVRAFGRSGVEALRRSGVQVFRTGKVKDKPATAGLERLNARTPQRLNARTPERLNAAQYRDLVVLLAAAAPDVALAAAARLASPADRAATLEEMGTAIEARDPVRAAVLCRHALKEAGAISDRRARQAAVIEAATGLAAFDLTAARLAVAALPGPVPVSDVMMLAARAAKRQPEAAGRLLRKLRAGNPAAAGMIAGSGLIRVAEVATEPQLMRALAMAQEGSPDVQATALLTVARRLQSSPEESAKARRDEGPTSRTKR